MGKVSLRVLSIALLSLPVAINLSSNICDARITKPSMVSKKMVHAGRRLEAYASSDPYYYMGSPFVLPPYNDGTSSPSPSPLPSDDPLYCVYPSPPFLVSPSMPSPPPPPSIYNEPPLSFSPPPPPLIYNEPPLSSSPPPPPSIYNEPPNLPSPPPPQVSPPPLEFYPSPPPAFNPTPSPPNYYQPSPPSPISNPPIIPVLSPPPPPSYEPTPPFNLPPSPPVMYLPPIFQPPILYPPPLPPPSPPSSSSPGSGYGLWCVAKPAVPDPIIQEAMNYACGSGAQCDLIQPSGSCYEPNTLIAHASVAFNSYWQRTKAAGGNCDFGGTAMLVTRDPSFDGCHFLRT